MNNDTSIELDVYSHIDGIDGINRKRITKSDLGILTMIYTTNSLQDYKTNFRIHIWKYGNDSSARLKDFKIKNITYDTNIDISAVSYQDNCLNIHLPPALDNQYK